MLPHVKTGKLKVLGVTSAAPLPQFLGVAPIGATVKGFESSAWFGLFGPAGLPPDVLQALYQAARKGLDITRGAQAPGDGRGAAGRQSAGSLCRLRAQ
ncbi:tripartite tricarboxylate transporter substrate-binding protein [Cupriavidus basilensis]